MQKRTSSEVSESTSEESSSDHENAKPKARTKSPDKRPMKKLKPVSSPQSSSDSEHTDRPAKANGKSPVKKPPDRRAKSDSPDDFNALLAKVTAKTASASRKTAAANFSPSSSEIEMFDNDALDPELAAIVANSVVPITARGSDEMLKMKVRMKAGPKTVRTADNADGLRAYERSMNVQIRRSQAFDSVIEAVEREKLVSGVVLTHKGRRVYGAATPAGLGLSSGAELGAWAAVRALTSTVCYTASDWADVQKDPTLQSRPATDPDIEVIETSFIASPPKKTATLRLALRGPNNLVTERAFAKSTQIVELLEIFLTEHKLLDKKRNSSIELDGERLKPSSTLADLDDLEDDDALDVKIAL